MRLHDTEEYQVIGLVQLIGLLRSMYTIKSNWVSHSGIKSPDYLIDSRIKRVCYRSIELELGFAF